MSHSDTPRAPAAAGRLVAAVAFLAGGAAALLVLGFFGLWGYAFTPGPTAERQVMVAPGSSVGGIRRLLAAEGVVPDDRRFEALALLMGVAGRLRAGEYRIPASATPYEVLELLARGDTVLHRITIPEGSTMIEIADWLAAAGIVDRDAFLALCRDAEFCRSLGVAAPSLEGYLFPDTYRFARRSDPRRVITVMVRQGERVWRELTADRPPAMDRHAVLTLASIVEKETGVAAERPLVAGVFLERLRRGMRLQADPTVIYGLGAFSRPLTRRDLEADTPYNTYRYAGLPPGPIANPGRAAIASVLQPRTGYLYFVSRNDGTHEFSATLREHNRAVRKYQRRRNGKSLNKRKRVVRRDDATEAEQ